MILVLLTNNQMKLEYLTQENINLFNSCIDAEKILEQIYFNYEFFSTETFTQYLDEGLPTKVAKANNENHISVRKVRFTPSALIFEPPEVDVSNRITRKFNFPDYYIRVSIEDENSQKRIWRQCKNILDNFKKYFFSLYIAGRHYEFLGFSNSQMKNHSL